MTEPSVSVVVHTTPTGLPCVELAELPASALLPLCEWLQAAFGFVPQWPPVVGPDQVILNAHHPDGRMLRPGWDIWSGCYLMAEQAGDRPLIEQIAKQLNVALTAPAFLHALQRG